MSNVITIGMKCKHNDRNCPYACEARVEPVVTHLVGLVKENKISEADYHEQMKCQHIMCGRTEGCVKK